jgi:hypothetical protein
MRDGNDDNREIYTQPMLIEVGKFSEVTRGSLVPYASDSVLFHGF